MMAEKNRNIIIIDDDQHIWAAYREVLSPARPSADSASGRMIRLLEGDDPEGREDKAVFTLSFAAQGQEGYEMIVRALNAGHPYAVAFIDIRMPPGWDGMETAVRIRQLDPNIEIVIVTAYGDRSPGEIVLAVGCPEKLLYLRKPFDQDELTQIALSLTEKWNLGRQEEMQRRELQTVLTSTPAAIFTVDPDSRIISWNPAADLITGYSSAEVLGRSCIFRKIAIHDPCRACLAVDPEKQGYAQRELAIRDRKGRQRTILLSGSSVFSSSGRKIKVVESFWDISARREAEEALHRSESRFRALVETTSDWVWEVDRDGIFTYCSPVCEAIYGYLPDELLGRSLFDVILPVEATCDFKDFFARCVAGISGFQGVERRCRRKDGRSVYIESSAVPVFSGNAGVVGFRGIDRDITERKKNEEERLRLEEEARQSQKMEALGTLAGGIAHDLNNLLTPILGYAQLAQAAGKPSDKLRDYLQVIEKSAARGAELISQILTFSRKQVMARQTLQLNDLIHNFSKMLKRLVREDIEFHLNLADDLWPIYADRGQVEQILINLVVNARDALPRGGQVLITTKNRVIPAERPVIDVDHKPVAGSFVLLTVSDTGIGMEREIIERVFDPFFTTKEFGQGTGIGLSTVYGIVSQHEGHILVDSNPGQGTTFNIYLPRSLEALHDPAEEEALEVRGGQETILLVEDSAEVRELARTALEHYGYSVIEAGTGTEALKIFAKEGERIDLLFTDIIMPGMGGRELVENLRGMRPELPVIFMSGHPADVSLVKLVAQQKTIFIQKPFRPEFVALKIREVLGEKGEGG